ncbi:MAG: tRNA (guanosine(46)-N7)-methyltransferase TrmB [Chitinophagaceae bacterium]
MGQKKLLRFEAIKSFPNVLQYPENTAGNWRDFFKNQHPLVLELACGKGEYAVGLANLYPEKNFLGVDIKGNRLYVGAKNSMEKGLTNAAFLRAQIISIDKYFAKDEVDEIWITFPDPQLRISKAKKRLTHPSFLRLYNRFLKAGRPIHLKTDSTDLYLFTKRVINLFGLTLLDDQPDLYSFQAINTELQIKTHYESLDISGSRKIQYLKFSLPSELPMLDEQLQKQLVQESLQAI